MRDGRNKKRLAMTAEEAAVRIEEIRRVHTQGFLSWGEFEAMKRSIEARVERTHPSRAA